MTSTRARKRSLTVLVTTGLLTAGTLAGCASSAESQQKTLEDDGYSNVRIVEGTTHPYMFSAVLHGCTIELFVTQDKGVWAASITTLANGAAPSRSYTGDTTFEPAGKAQGLAANPRFTAYCP